MGKKVYGLKHATGLMKIQHMHMMMDFKADLKEKQMSYLMEQMLERQSALMFELMELDLAWEAWFDNNDNVPEFGSVKTRIEILERRIADLKTPAPLMLVALQCEA